MTYMINFDILINYLFIKNEIDNLLIQNLQSFLQLENTSYFKQKFLLCLSYIFNLKFHS
jgi:hypothetical protein